MEAGVRASASFADGILGTATGPCATGTPTVPATHSPPLSGDVLRAYENYNREIMEAGLGFFARGKRKSQIEPRSPLSS